MITLHRGRYQNAALLLACLCSDRYDSDDSLEPYDMDDRPASHPDYPDPPPPPVQLREAFTAISKQSKDMHKVAKLLIVLSSTCNTTALTFKRMQAAIHSWCVHLLPYPTAGIGSAWLNRVAHSCRAR